MINWNDDVLIDEMRMIMLLDSWTMTETERSMEFIKEDKLLRVEKQSSPRRDRCNLYIGDVYSTKEVGIISFDSRIDALRYLNLEARDDDDPERIQTVDALGWMDD